MKQEQPRPLDRVLLRLLLLRLVLPSLAVILLAVWLVGYLVTHNLGTQQLQLARSLAYTVDDHLEHASRVVGAVAQVAQSATVEELALYMQATQRAYGCFDALYQLDESGHITMLAPPDPRYQGLDLSRQPYFGQASAKTGVTISQPFISLRTGQPTVYVAQPLADDGLVVGELNLGALQEAIAAALDEPGRNTIFVADCSGTLLAHPRSDLVAQQANVGHLDVVQRGLVGQATLFYSTDGTLVLGSAVPVERAGWVIVAQSPLAVAYGPYIRVTTPLLLFAPVVWLALIWSLRQRLSHHVVTPLARLSQGAEALSAGDFAQGAALAAIPVAFTEVGALAADFERMGQAIQARQAALQESEERYRRLVDNAPDIIFRWSIEKGLEYVSPIVFEVTGYTPKELMADPMLGFKIATGNDPQLAADYQRAIAGGTTLPSREYPYARKDGSQAYLDVRSAAIRDDEGNVTALEGILSDITERKRAEERVQRLLNQQIAVNRLAFALGEFRDLDKIYHTIYEYIQSLMGVEAFIVSFYDDETQLLHAGYVVSEGSVRDTASFPPIPLEEVGSGTQSQVIHTGQPFYVPDLRKALERTKTEHSITENGTVSEGPPPEEQDISRSSLYVPMKIEGETIGVMQVQSFRLDAYSQEDIDLLSALANVAAIAIQNARLYEEVQQRALEQRALREAALALTTILDRNEVVERILAQLQEVVPYDSASVQLLRGKRLEIVGGRGFPNLPDLLGLSFPVGGDNPNSEVVRTQAPFIVEDGPAVYGGFQREPHAQAGIRSWLGVPMLVGERLVGMIALDKQEPGFYMEEHAHLALAFAAQAAVAIENARLYQTEQRGREVAEALQETARVVNASLSLDKVLPLILEQLAQVIEYDSSAVLLLDDGRFKVTAGRGFPDLEAALRLSFSAAEDNLASAVMRARRPLIVEDVQNDPRWQLDPQVTHIRGWIGAPLIVRDRVIGVLTVDSSQPGTYSEEDGQLVFAFANQAAVAIENARLYQELRDHAGELERRVQERTAQLQAQYARLDAILRSASDGIIVADGQGEIIQANPVAQTWLTRTLSPEDAAWLREAVRSLAQEASAETAPGKWPEMVLELTGLDLELKAAPISEPGLEEAAVVVAVHDVSHLKALNRMKSRFVTNISHELRTPITTIKLYAALMQQTSPEEEKWKQYVDALSQEADHQARLVEDILQISRIDAGRLEMKPRPICLNELTGVAIASHQVLAQDQGLILQHRPAEPGPVALVDPERMMQALSNLIGNAIRYTSAGGQVVVSTGKEESEERTWATVTVADTGMGIPEEELPHVFERFFRGEKPRKMQVSGTGLGLAIVREIVELHGGRVTVESKVGVGTTFVIWLPLADAQV